MQYIRDRIHAPGALAGGSSYVNLLDGDAQTVAFTVATRERMSVYRRLGGRRMALLILLHPIRDRCAWSLQAVARVAARGVGAARRRAGAARGTHSEGCFRSSASSATSIVRELQTMAILLDVYLGVPVIYSTFMQYDELGASLRSVELRRSRDLRRTDARIREISADDAQPRPRATTIS